MVREQNTKGGSLIARYNTYIYRVKQAEEQLIRLNAQYAQLKGLWFTIRYLDNYISNKNVDSCEAA